MRRAAASPLLSAASTASSRHVFSMALSTAFAATVVQKTMSKSPGCRVFFYNASAPTAFYTLSLHDARPVCGGTSRTTGAWATTADASTDLFTANTDAAPMDDNGFVAVDGKRACGERGDGKGSPVAATASDRKSTRLNSSHW